MSGRTLEGTVGVYVAIAIAIGYTSYRSTGSLLSAISVALLAALVAAIGFGLLNRRTAARLTAAGLEDGNFPARIEVSLVTAADPGSAITITRKAIEELPNFKNLTIYEAGPRIVARTRRSIDSWGEKITVTAKATNVGTTLTTRSVPALWTVIEDMRMNFQNVALIVRHVDRMLDVVSLEPSVYLDAILRTQDVARDP